MKKLEIVIPEGMGGRADKVLATLLPEVLPRDLREAFARRDVKRNGQRIAADAGVSSGDALAVFVRQVQPLQVVHGDEAYVVINKPQGMPTQGPGSIEAVYAREHGEALEACHRLDVQTGGLLLLARSEAARMQAEEMMAAHKVGKTYEAIVCGVPQPEEAVLHAFLRKDADAAKVTILGHPAPHALSIETHYRLLDTDGTVSRLEVGLITGRTHQIRAHLAHIGHPILGDDKYGDRAMNRRYGLRKQLLWATRLVLWDGREFTARAEFPLLQKEETQ